MAAYLVFWCRNVITPYGGHQHIDGHELFNAQLRMSLFIECKLSWEARLLQCHPQSIIRNEDNDGTAGRCRSLATNVLHFLS